MSADLLREAKVTEKHKCQDTGTDKEPVLWNHNTVSPAVTKVKTVQTVNEVDNNKPFKMINTYIQNENRCFTDFIDGKSRSEENNILKISQQQQQQTAFYPYNRYQVARGHRLDLLNLNATGGLQ